jgi:rhodanese-related sulfurtransferase
LTKVDLYRYDDRWEKEASEAIRQFFHLDSALATKSVPVTSKVTPNPDTAIIDLRQPLDFEDFHLPGSVNVPFVHEDTPSPFSDPQVLDALWRRLEDTFRDGSGVDGLRDLTRNKQVLLLCYDGDSARVATSVLRAKGCEADSVKGGFRALRKLREVSSDDGVGNLRAGTGEQQSSTEVIKGLWKQPITITAQTV